MSQLLAKTFHIYIVYQPLSMAKHRFIDKHLHELWQCGLDKLS